ncbi:MAG: hypothetical protein HY901_32560 [Deltaproteobacteria bacterium]|nr:hypothetical protein [Deltaproteobacteria bacterium]
MKPIDFETALYLASAAGSLFLAALVSLHARHVRGAVPLVFLNLSLLLWDTGEAMIHLTNGNDTWRHLTFTIVTIPLPLLLQFLFSFCQYRLARRWRAALFAGLGLFTLVTALSLVEPTFRAFVEGSGWNLVFLGLSLPTLSWAIWLVLQRRRQLRSASERGAIGLLGVGVGAGLLISLSELLHGMDLPVPQLGSLGSFIFAAALTAAVLRPQILEAEMPLWRVLALLLAAGAAVTVNLWLIAHRTPHQGFAILAAGGLSLALLALYRLLVLRWYEGVMHRRHLASIGAMAAGVAHEIRNPLTAIKSAAQLVARELSLGQGSQTCSEYLQLVVSEADRLNRVVEGFLSYARPPRPRLRSLALAPIIQNVVGLQRIGLSPRVVLSEDLAPTLPPLRMDPDLLKQALLNVLKNAVEAVGEAGTVAVKAQPARRGRRPGVSVEIDDSGPGLAPEQASQLFQPFCTSKPNGSGLGLAITRRILEAHGGSIEVANREVGGVRVTLWLPKATAG